MNQVSLEHRVAAIEEKVAALEIALANGPSKHDWMSTVGTGIWDETAKRIDEAGRKWREAERRKARRKKPKARRAK